MTKKKLTEKAQETSSQKTSSQTPESDYPPVPPLVVKMLSKPGLITLPALPADSIAESLHPGRSFTRYYDPRSPEYAKGIDSLRKASALNKMQITVSDKIKSLGGPKDRDLIGLSALWYPDEQKGFRIDAVVPWWGRILHNKNDVEEFIENPKTKEKTVQFYGARLGRNTLVSDYKKMRSEVDILKRLALSSDATFDYLRHNLDRLHHIDMPMIDNHDQRELEGILQSYMRDILFFYRFFREFDRFIAGTSYNKGTISSHYDFREGKIGFKAYYLENVDEFSKEDRVHQLQELRKVFGEGAADHECGVSYSVSFARDGDLSD